MNIDLANPAAPNNLTLANVAQMIASVDDSEHRHLIITRQGLAEFREFQQETYPDELARFETLTRGGDHLGPDAAADDEWVARIHNALQANWPTPTDTYIDVF